MSTFPTILLSKRKNSTNGFFKILSSRGGYLPYYPSLGSATVCECGLTQTTSHIVEECQRTRFEGGVATLHACGQMAIKWLEELDIRL